MSSAAKPVIGSRVNQLDAVELDEQLFSLFRTKLSDVLKHVDGNFFASYEPELKAILKIVLYGLTVHERGSTVGQRLLGLQYFAGPGTLARCTGKQTLALLTLGVLLPWLRERWRKIGERLLPPQECDAVERGICHVETGVRVASVVNFMLFLLRGNYSSLATRLVGVVNGHEERQLMREVQFDFMNRELLWHGFAEFISFLLPLLNLYPLKNLMIRKVMNRNLVPTSPNARTLDDFAACGLCGETPTQAHEIGCRHVFCYYCVASQMTADASFTCPLCNCPSQGLQNLRRAALALKKK